MLMKLYLYIDKNYFFNLKQQALFSACCLILYQILGGLEIL